MNAWTRLLTIAAVPLLPMMLGACGGMKPDELRTVRSFDFATCSSEKTTDPTELEAISKFNRRVLETYFVSKEGSRYAANHEATPATSGLREYQGPFYIYVHQRQPERDEAAAGVDWVGTIFLHAKNVRTRANDKDWSEWQPVRTRNFTVEGRTVDGMPRWKCLLGAEIAWAEVRRQRDIWFVVPTAIGAYEGDEIGLALPLATDEQIAGTKEVSAGG